MRTGFFCVDCQTKDDYSVYVMRQASRRSWRIGQTRPVKVVFMSYRNTLQADALKLVAKKLQSSLAVEGELPEDGLAAFGDDGDDMMMALARKIVSREEDDEAETVEEVFAQARNAETAAEELLVDDGWRVVEVEPEAIAVNGNGKGHQDADGIGLTVELVPAKVHANGNGERPRACPGQWQRSLRRCRGAAAVAVLLGGVHGRAGQAQEPQGQDSGSVPIPLRVGGGTGAGRPSQSALDARAQHNGGRTPRFGRPLPGTAMYPAFFAFQGKRPGHLVGLSVARNTSDAFCVNSISRLVLAVHPLAADLGHT